MPAYTDTFVEASDTSLFSHTPTGSNPASGWTSYGGGGANLVVGGGNYVRDNSTSSGNRAGLNNDLGTEDMWVSFGLELVNNVAGDFTFAGCTVRSPSASVGGNTEVTYDVNLSSWVIGFTSGSSTVAATWPGGIVNVLVTCNGPDIKLFVNGVNLLSATDTFTRGNTYAGIIQGNFTGNATKRSRISNFMVRTLGEPAFYLKA